jgi:hypothetical protein
MHDAQIPHRRQQYRHREIYTEHAGSEIASWDSYCVTRPERNGIEGATVLAQRPLCVGTSVDITEDKSRDAAARQFAEISDARCA